ncbi:unnamed protein product [Linum tenue]|uniref:Glycosyltransferase n=1 Tax=Linum tenue TaxID=586396 RepID=A0AAV0IXV6_9ROSI|nr:unnamed protein product [Linum tenue]
MRKMKKKKKKVMTILMVPYPAQGHLTPMLHLASSFLHLHDDSHYTFAPVLLLPHFLHRQISAATTTTNVDPRISLVPIPPPDEEEQSPPPGDFFAIDKAIEEITTAAGQMEAVVRRHVINDEDAGVCMVVDLLVSSAVDVARRCDVPVAGFWPAALLTYRLIAAIPRLVAAGLIHPHSGIPQHSGAPIGDLLPGQPPLSTDDLPWLIGSPAARKARFKFWTKTLNRSTTLQCLLVNSSPGGGQPDEFHQHQQPQVLQIGPLISQQTPIADNSSNHVTFSFWEQDSSCLQWLATQKPNSVLYISFGSWVGPIGEPKVRALATSLEAIGIPFLWVLGPTWRQGLPRGFEHDLSVSHRGRVVTWAPQMEVLRHGAVGCYLTHCGWNSTVEAVQCRKRMLCFPVAGDQFVNCRYIVEKWRVGVELSGFGRQELEEGLEKVMGDGEMNGKLESLYELSLGKEAKCSAIANLNAFVHLLIGKTHDL